MVQVFETLEIKARLLAEAIAQMQNTAEKDNHHLGTDHYWTALEAARALQKDGYNDRLDDPYKSHPSDSIARTTMLNLADNLIGLSNALCGPVDSEVVARAEDTGRALNTMHYTPLEGKEALQAILHTTQGGNALLSMRNIPRLMQDTEDKAAALIAEYDSLKDGRRITRKAYEALTPRVNELAQMVEKVPAEPLMQEVQEKVRSAWSDASYSFGTFVNEFDKLKSAGLNDTWKDAFDSQKAWINAAHDAMKCISNTKPEFLKKELQKTVPMTYKTESSGMVELTPTRAEVIANASGILQMACANMYDHREKITLTEEEFEPMMNHMRTIMNALNQVETSATIFAAQNALKRGKEIT